MRRCTTVLLFALLVSSHIFAQTTDESISVTARFDRSVASADEVVRLVVTVAAKSNLNDINIRLPELADFELLSEQTSRQISQINNRIEISFAYSYTLLPKRAGTLRVPSFEVSVAGNKYRTEPLTIHASESRNITEILVRQVPDKRTAYVGEQIVVTLEILFRISIDRQDITKETPPQGFIVKYDDSIGPNALTDSVEVGGMPYRRAIIRRSILFPISAGPKRLEPIDFIFSYRPQRFDFNRRIVKITTEPVDIEVLPLPDPTPLEFTGAVGDYSIDWSIDSAQGKANEPLTLSISLSGVGDLERAPDIRPTLPSDFEILEGSVSDNASFINGFWSGTKRWDYIVIPKRSGEPKFEPLQFSFFDPETETYQQAVTEPISLTISAADRATTFTLPAPMETETAEGDIRYIRTGAISDQSNGFLGGFWFWMLIVVPPALNISLLALRAIVRTFGSKDVRGERRRSALSVALSKLKRAERTADNPVALGLLRDAVIGYFADKMEVDATGLTLADIRADMVRRDLHESDAFSALTEVILACEAERYSQSINNASVPGELSKRAVNALGFLDQCL